MKGKPVEEEDIPEELEELGDGEYLTIPEEVVCKKCSEHFRTEGSLFC